MGECEDCGEKIADKYNVCVKCLGKRQAANRAEASKDVLKSLSAVNNNLYAIRRLLSIMVRERHEKEIVWDRAKKDFVEREAKISYAG